MLTSDGIGSPMEKLYHKGVRLLYFYLCDGYGDTSWTDKRLKQPSRPFYICMVIQK